VVFGICQHSSHQGAINGLTLIPWQGGKSLAWDVTIVSTLAQSYVDRAASGVGMVAELAAE